MNSLLRAVFFLWGFLLGFSLGAQSWDLERILKSFSSLDFFYQSFPFTTEMVSTYDRTGGNKDGDNFFKIEQERAVLAEIKGSGIITRIYSAYPRGTLQLYLDDSEEPIISMPAQEFFSGENFPFVAPLVGDTPAGYSYFPLPFEKSARIEIKKDPNSPEARFGLYWQVEYLRAESGVEVKSLSLPLTRREKQALDRLLNFLKNLQTLSPPRTEQEKMFEKKIPPNRKIELFSLTGSRVIRSLELELEPENKEALSSFLSCRLLGYWDDEDTPSVFSRLGYFFAQPFSTPRLPGILLQGEIRSGRFLGKAFFPMPFSRSARFELENSSTASGRIQLKLDLDSLEKDSGWRFHTLERAERLKPDFSRKNLSHRSDYLVFSAKGAGRFIGLFLWVLNRYFIWWGEGDESFFIDGHLVWQGTGTEDYFDGSYKRFGNNLFAHSLLENSLGKGYAGISLLVRFHLLDPVYFQQSLVMKFEHGRWANDLDNWYGSVAYWYQSEAHFDFSGMKGEEIELSPSLAKELVKESFWQSLSAQKKFLLFLPYFLGAVILILAGFFAVRFLKNLKGGRRSG